MNIGAEILPLPDLLNRQSRQFRTGNLNLPILIEGSVMTPLVATERAILAGHTEADLVLGFVKRLSKEMVGRGLGRVEYTENPQAPETQVAIPLQGESGIDFSGHIPYYKRKGKNGQVGGANS